MKNREIGNEIYNRYFFLLTDEEYIFYEQYSADNFLLKINYRGFIQTVFFKYDTTEELTDDAAFLKELKNK